jgi:hypothetical protein
VLAMMLAQTLAITTPALANDFATAKPIPGYSDYEITDTGFLILSLQPPIRGSLQVVGAASLFSFGNVRGCTRPRGTEAIQFSPRVAESEHKHYPGCELLSSLILRSSLLGVF